MTFDYIQTTIQPLKPLCFILYSTLIALSAIVVLPILVIARLFTFYDLYFNYIFGEWTRALVSRRLGVWIVPLLPLYSLTWRFLALTNMFACFVWVTIGVVLVEIHSVCLHRESWIAAFEPEWIPRDACALGGIPNRLADRRLHHILLILIIYAIPLLVVGVSVHTALTWQCFIAALFIIRYFEYARIDFETCIHWNMHCKVLVFKDKPRLSKFWEALMDYLVGPLSGYVPRVYNANHLLVHHHLNGNTMDIHSTTPFRRNSFLEFCYFAMKLAGSIMFATDLAFHKKVQGRTRLSLLAHVFGFWIVVAALLLCGRLLAPLFILFTIHHGVIMARFQYVWHGLVDPSNPNQLITTTTLWVSSEKFWSDMIAEITVPTRQQQVSTNTIDEIPEPGTDWAYFDNYHLLHHLKPNAHFTQYPALLKYYAPQLLKAQSVVLTLNIITTFPFDCWTSNIDRIINGLQIDLSDAEKRKFIRTRLEPVPGNRHPIAAVCESNLARIIEQKLLKLLEISTGGQ